MDIFLKSRGVQCHIMISNYALLGIRFLCLETSWFGRVKSDTGHVFPNLKNKTLQQKLREMKEQKEQKWVEK